MARRTNLALVIMAVSGLFALCEPMWSSEAVESLIAHWKFDEGAGDIAYDSAGYNDGTLVNGPVWTTGRIDLGLDFDGVDDYVDVGDPVDGSLDFGAGESFSISVWVKTAEDGQPVYKQTCTGVGGVYHEGYRVRVLLEKPYFGFKDTGDNGSQIFGNTVITDDQWHHMVAVRDTGTDKLYLYLDGSSDAAPVTDNTTGTLATSRSFDIGRADSTVSPGISYFTGKIDDVRIYDRALSAEEVQQLYLAGAGPIAHWKFDEGEGDIAYDSAGDNDGTIYGAQWTSGIIDGALDFDGVDDYVDLGNDDSLKPPLPVTLSAWVKFSQNNANFISLDDLSSRYCGVWLSVNPENHLSAAFGDGDGWGDASYRRSKEGTTGLSPDTWYHVAAVVRGTTDMSLYINGADDGGTYSGSGGSLAYSSGNASIGTAHYENIHFNGKIDDVRIYDRALSAEEIWDLYLEGAGPIAHWKFDEGEGDIAYDSAGDNDGTIYGAQWASGIIDGALDFDGVDDYVDIGNDSSLKPTLPVTLSAWVRFSQNGRTIISLDDSSSAYYGLWMDINVENHQTVAFGDGTGWGSSSYRRGKYGTTVLSPDVWYHVVGVARGATDMSIYINGVDDGGTYSGSGGSLAYSSGNATIATSHYHDLYFEGKIDDVRIYDRALSAEEIRQLYRKGVSGDSTRVHTMSAINNIGRAIREKVEEWMKIDDTLRKEWEAYKALDETLMSGDYGDLSYGDIVTARQEIYASIGHGRQSKEALEKSIERLESALAALGFELVPKASAWLEQAKRAMP